MSQLSKAIRLAAQIHDGQTDKGGEDYILHPLAVMHLVEFEGEPLGSQELLEVRCVAVLHDVKEDFEGDSGEHHKLDQQIYDMCGDRVCSSIERLTKYSDETYEGYIERVAGDWMARRTKRADLKHNMDVARLPEGEIGELDFNRWNKYRKAYVRLSRGA